MAMPTGLSAPAHKPDPTAKVKEAAERRAKASRGRAVSLRLILTAALLIIGIGPVVFFMLRFIPAAEQKIVLDTREQHLAAGAPATTLISHRLAQNEDELRRLASFFAVYNDAPDRMQRVGDLLSRRILDRFVSENIPYIAYFGENGIRIEAKPLADAASGKLLSDDPAIVEKLALLERRGDRGRRESLFVRARGETWHLVLMPIRSGDVQNGALVAIFSLDQMRSVLRQQFQVGSMGFALIDRTGAVYLNGGSLGNTVGESLADDPLFTSIRNDDGSLPMGGANKNAQRQVAGGTQNLIVSYSPVEDTGLGLLIFSDEKFVFTATRKMRAGAMTAGAILALLAIVLGLVMGGVILSPISALMAATRRIAQGEFNQRAPRSLFSELNALSEDFNHMDEEIQRLIGDLSLAAETNKKLFVGTVRAIANALDAKDPYTRGHSERVSRYAKLIAEEHGVRDPAEIERCEISALLHDIGKVGVEDAILRKPAALTDAEFEIMKQHPGRGAQILGAIAEMKDIIPGVRNHHERWSGGGYPDNLAGEKIPVQARIVAVADTLDAMTTERPYQRAMSMAVAAARINQLAGKSFDPGVVESFNRAYQKGSLTIGAEKKLIIPKNRPQVA